MGQPSKIEDWKGIWAEYGPRLLLFARQQTSEPDQAEDLVQEAFVRYWKARQRDPSLKPVLLFTMLKRGAIDQARKRQSRQARETEAHYLDQHAFFTPDFEDWEKQAMVEASLRRLPEAQREVLVLKIWSGLTFEEIGDTLEISPNTAASRYRYGLNQLKELLTPAFP